MNLRTGSRMQQACDPGVEQAVKVVRDHEDGRRRTRGSVGPKMEDRSEEGRASAFIQRETIGTGHTRDLEAEVDLTSVEAEGTVERPRGRSRHVGGEDNNLDPAMRGGGSEARKRRSSDPRRSDEPSRSTDRRENDASANAACF
jgi:hypothetical protein